MRLLLSTLFLSLVILTSSKQSFTIDWENDRFVKDGETFQYASAGMHYFRIPYQYWKHRISAAKSAGLNVIQTYVAWNEHEPTPGNYRFTGQQNLIGFIEEAAKQDMPVILRVGPYICAEWDFGGIPPWVMNIPGMAIRSMNKPWLTLVRSWLDKLLPSIVPYLYNNGGNIIMVQVENEYGSYGCDHDYMTKLQGIFLEYLGDETVLFTTDGAGDHYVLCGSLRNIFTTIDFGVGDPAPHFAMLRKHQSDGPLVNSEFYTGWLDHYGEKHQTRNAKSLGVSMDKILALNASVNLYMWHGGTNFGLTSGAEGDYRANPTSYDYDAPQSEWGDVKLDKYWAIRNVTEKYFGKNKAPVPADSKKWDGGVMKMPHAYPLINLFEVPQYNLGLYPYPRTMESLEVYNGVVAYVHNTMDKMSGNLTLLRICDRAYLMIDGVYVMVGKRLSPTYKNSINVTISKSIVIYVENMGHVGYGGGMKDNFKGLLGNVTLNGEPIVGWQHYYVPVTAPKVKMFDQAHIETLAENSEMYQHNVFLFNDKPLLPHGPTIFFTMFQGNPDRLDTFIDITCWSKGFVSLNDNNLGRYWPDAGPQYTLYAPGPYFMVGYNILTITEMQSSCDGLIVKFTVVPNIDGPFNPNA